MELKIYNPQADGFLKAIDWNFEELKEEITKKSSDYLNLVYSDDQIKDAKQDRANLRKLVTALENKRKEIKKEIMVPYDDFASKEKELVEIINGAIEEKAMIQPEVVASAIKEPASDQGRSQAPEGQQTFF